MVFEIINNNSNTILVVRVLLIMILGILVGFILKHAIRKGIDSFVLKRLFREEVKDYETARLITKIFTEIIQWGIIFVFVNYALILVNINILSRFFSEIIKQMPRLVIFATIILAGFVISKLITARLKKKIAKNQAEIKFILEIIINAAFILTALEYIGVKATALVELFKVILYTLAILVVLLIVRPDILKKQE